MQYLPQSSPCMNPPNSSAARAVVIRGMGADSYNAAVKGSEEVIKKYQDFLGSQLTATGNTVLHLHVGVPARKGGIPKIEFIQTVLHCEGSLLLQKNDDDEIPLHLAARFGHVNAVEVFISKANVMGAGCLREMLMTTDRNQDTALHLAARWNRVEIVSMVLAADVSCQYARNKDGESPLYIAAGRRYPNVVAKILDACESPTYDGTLGRTALHAAVALEHEGMLYKMLEKNNTLLRSQDDKGQTPLHCAAGFKRKTADCRKILAILLQYDDRSSHSSAVYIRDNEGRTALHLAILYGSFLRIKALINHRPDCCEIRDNKGQNLFHYAAKSGSLHTVRYLLSKGIFSKLLNQKDQEGNMLGAMATCGYFQCPTLERATVGHTHLKTLTLATPLGENPDSGIVIFASSILLFRVHGIEEGCVNLGGDSTLKGSAPLSGRKSLQGSDSITAQLVNLAFTRDRDVDLMVSNRENQTVGDILYSRSIFKFGCVRVPRSIYRLAPSGVEPDKSQGYSDKNKERMMKQKKRSGVHLIVATLIAAVSFAAGIAVPGGFNQDLGADQGTALLSRETAFRAFIMSDALALTFSAIAVMICFHLATLENPLEVQMLSYFSLFATSLSLEGMMAAFLTGTWAMVYQSGYLVSIVIGVFISFTIYYAYHLISLLIKSVIEVIKDDPYVPFM